ncbi:PrsW family intramembrane metalloprotease [Streptomyces sp. NBC_01498]|uniref:PrsW family intramembrane metalloprotease n=1 Tax=Streptomyces sp. NBC_01498 TaxID=2975870 RepID=UPI002E7C3186|nr:PrsW family intramembrane metalloprotease [Streptomyces sp. NBC_01498]WTL23378.1 PrsW family intramembrane metalloprotease [Streptomyces sp. NBC_01498]
MPTVMRKWAWLPVLAVGLGLYFIVQATLVDTGNVNYVPAMIMLGAVVVPLSFLTFVAGRTGQWQVGPFTLGIAALFGGVVGIVTAGQLEFDTLRGLGTSTLIGIGLIEESCKLIVPVLILVWQARRGTVRVGDGLLIGVAAGMGFAALETMGYAFTALLASQGNIGDVEETLLLRGLTSPAAHMAWTGLVCGALWGAVAARWSLGAVVRLVVTFLAAVALHALWDGTTGRFTYVLLALVSLGWLFFELHRGDTLSGEPPTADAGRLWRQ